MDPGSGIALDARSQGLDSLLQQHRVPSEIQDALQSEQFDVASFGMIALSLQEFDQRLDELNLPSLTQNEPLETLAPLILHAIYDECPWTEQWETLLWHMAQHYSFWLVAPLEPPPSRIQINCGGLGGALSMTHMLQCFIVHTQESTELVFMGPHSRLQTG